MAKAHKAKLAEAAQRGFVKVVKPKVDTEPAGILVSAQVMKEGVWLHYLQPDGRLQSVPQR